MPDERYWNERYLQGNMGWDIGDVSPPLRVYFDQLTAKDAAILIPGCGNSYEAEYLLKKGFTNITLLDISPVLIGRLRERLPATPALRLLEADFFDHQGAYDLIVEQTFFCALDPARRPAYAEQMHDLLKPGGHLAGLLFDRDFGPNGPPDGPEVGRPKANHPPFGGHTAEYQNLFEKRFRLRTLTPCYNSIKPRAGTELFLIAERPAPEPPAA
ncbi:MAG TPA: methyltransferase [Puia sp.]|nr:methyltransferase [Puia sp.]